jgi:catechol 2,3-dioxygenase-like lactoylglutathione lyase family enzyme
LRLGNAAGQLAPATLVERGPSNRILEELIMNVLFVTSVAIVAADPPESRKLYVDALGLPLEGRGGDYFASEQVGGSKHFGVWPLAEAAQACFGTRDWPGDRPVPQVSVEFEVESEAAVGEAASELEAQGYELLHPARTEPWGQTVARIQSIDGAIVGLSYAPSLHEDAA